MNKLLILFFVFALIGIAHAGIIPPETTFSYEQLTGTTDTNITLTCTDNNSGCKTINSNINNEGWKLTNYLSSDTNYNYQDLNNSVVVNGTTTYVLSHTVNIPVDTNYNFKRSYVSTAYLSVKEVSLTDMINVFLQFIYNDGTDFNTSVQNSNPGASYTTLTFTNTSPQKIVTRVNAYFRASSGPGNNKEAKDLNVLYINEYSVTNPLSFIYSGAGDHNIQYFSTDNADNNESIKTSFFSTYGLAKFTLKDENSGLDLDDVTYTISPSINGDSGGTLTGTNQLDLNLTGITSQEYTITFSKTGYEPRTYQTTLNQFSDIDINFALLPTSLSTDIPFKVYRTDETTIFANTFIELYKPNTGFIVGRKKTNSNGEVTFSIHVSDQNYYANVNNGQYTYQPVALTVLYPKDEETLNQITERWRIDITQNLYESFTDLNTNKIVYLLPNTSLPFNIRIADMNGNYFARTYAQQFPGNPLTATLQPYLIKTTTGILTTIRTVSAYNNQPVGQITIKIYKNISGLGRTLVEQIITDDKGEALIYSVTAAEYEFEIYQGVTYIRTDKITATSNIIYIRISNQEYVPPVLNDFSVTTSFSPVQSILQSFTTQLKQTITFNDYNSDVNIQKIYIIITNTLVNGTVGNNQVVYNNNYDFNGSNVINIVDINSLAQTINSVSYDTNGYLIIDVIIQINDVNYIDRIIYKPYTSTSIIETLGVGSRGFWGCNTNDPLIPCPNQLFIAIFISFITTAGIGFGLRTFSPSGLGIIFILIMGVFAFFTYVPIMLYGLLAAGTIVLIFASRGRFI
jgi:hypothetical protein